MLPFGITFSDQTTTILRAPSRPEAQDEAWRCAAQLTFAGYQRRDVGVKSIEEISESEAAYWPDPPPSQVGTDADDEQYARWCEDGKP